jgi:hypothetical protein
MKGKNYRKSIRTGHEGIIPFWRKTAKGKVLNRWLPAGISKLMPVLFIYRDSALIKTGRNLQPAQFHLLINDSRNSKMMINWPNHTLIPCFKSNFEIVLLTPETGFFTPSELVIKSSILQKWQRFDWDGGSV